MVAISSILMDNGNFIFWDGWQQPEPIVVWNPAAPSTFTTINAPDSVFCDGAAQLPDGRIIVIGGYGGLSTGQIGIVDTNIFDPATNTWTRVANMHLPRWYPTLTELSDGRYVAISGNSTDASHWADTPEVYDPTTNTWTLLSNISTSQVHEEEYPFSYLIPNGNVLTIGPSEDVTHELNVDNQTWTPVGGQSGVVNGSSVQYLPGKILYSGGASSVMTTHARAGHHRGPRHHRGHSRLAADRADALPAHLPHPDHAGERPGAGRGRRIDQRSERGHDRRAAHRDLGPDQRDVVGGGADRHGPQLPLDRGADARRARARRRRRSLRTG